MGFGGILRQSTAVDVLIGPFVSSTDGDTEMTGLTISQGDILLSKNGQTGAQKNDNTTAAHDADGFYNCELDATDTNTVGQLTLWVHEATSLAVRHDYQVVEEATYDALYAASAPGPATPTNITAGTITTATNVTTVNGLAANVITATSINNDAITAAKIADGAIDAATFASGAITATAIAADAIGASELAADAVAEIADAVWDEDATGHQTGGTFGQAIGDPVADTTTIYAAVVTAAAGTHIAADIIAVKAETAAIVADTNELQTDWADGGRLDVILDARASQTSVNTIDDILDTEFPALVTSVADLPTNAELATALGTADDAVLAAIAALNDLSATEVEDAVWDAALADHLDVDSTGEALSDAGGVGTPPTVDEIADEVETRALILHTDYDAAKTAASQTSVNDLPTNAELATALATADDAVLAAIAALNNLSAAQVNAEVVDALATDTYAEPTGVPAATATLAVKIGRLHQALRNAVTVTATKKQFFDDSAAALWEKDLSDDGTTYTETEGNAP